MNPASASSTPASSQSSSKIQQWPEQGDFLNEYTTMYLQLLAFPTLFPFAQGDVTNRDRQCE
eukprot:12730300-Ditylum_brightwellii.AAC.1